MNIVPKCSENNTTGLCLALRLTSGIRYLNRRLKVKGPNKRSSNNGPFASCPVITDDQSDVKKKKSLQEALIV